MTKSDAVCHECDCTVEVRREVRDFPAPEDQGVAVRVEALVCTKCDGTIGIPQDQQDLVRRQLRDLDRVVEEAQPV